MRVLGLVAALVLGGTAASAGTVVNFDTSDGVTPITTAANNLNGNEFSALGVTLASGTVEPLALFDSNCSGTGCTGNDPDLGVNLGNVLIINEAPSTASDPDDTTRGGSISFTFAQASTLDYADLVDVDNGEGLGGLVDGDPLPGSYSAFSFMLDVLGVGPVAATPIFTIVDAGAGNGDRSITRYSFSEGPISGFKLTLARGTSIAVAEVGFTPVPVPAAMPLLLAGMGALGWASRRRRKAA